MPKEKVTSKELVEQWEKNNARINEIADVCEKENRTRTEQEDMEYRNLLAKKEILGMRMAAAAHVQAEGATREENIEKAETIIRENVLAGRPTNIVFSRSNDPSGTGKLMMVADAATGGIIPITIEDFVKPIQEKVIYNQLPGLTIKTGLAGDYLWPTYEVVEATLAGEGVRLSDTEINLNQIKAKPERMGLAIPVTREALTQTTGALESLVKELMPMAVSRLVNKILIKPTKVNSSTLLKSPFVSLNTSSVPKVGVEPAFRDFLDMKGSLLDEGVDDDSLCWVMSASQKCIAEGTPKDAGSGIMVCENGRIAGIPVFTSSEMSGFVGLGDWRYQPSGFFGEMSFVIDPFTLARKGAVDFVLNADFATTTTEQKAFKLGKCVAKS